MTLQEALKELFESDTFKEAAKDDSNLRVYLLRSRRGELMETSAKRLLLRFGYTEDYLSPFKHRRNRNKTP